MARLLSPIIRRLPLCHKEQSPVTILDFYLKHMPVYQGDLDEALFNACKFNGTEDVVRFLVSRGANGGAVLGPGMSPTPVDTPLKAAIYYHNLPALSFFVSITPSVVPWDLDASTLNDFESSFIRLDPEVAKMLKLFKYRRENGLVDST
ncbi:hypothetical protein HDV00_005984 [Rhizophlyctis rosea]|nr:hypothetical protein HDV00_005984 [Rhizophlyctis rosea]